MQLLQPLPLRAATAPNRVMFGPHVTNLGDDQRRFTARHTAYYERRARGGCGVIVTEGASVHPSDWPYERAPLASECAEGWAAIASACHAHGSLVIASLDHAGGQGSSAYSQRELWAPSRVPEVNSREVPKWMEAADIAAVVAGFGVAAALAIGAGCDGVEINAGQHSLVRQFLSGLTNQRGDEWADRLLFARQVLAAVRAAAGEAIVGLRLSCDELAPWAGITSEMAVEIAAALAPEVDYLVVVRGSIFSAEKTRPDFHEPTGFNIGVCRDVRSAVGATPVFLQGSVVEWGQAEWAVGDGVCDAVEMTRAQIADPDLVAKLAADRGDDVRPCIRCNQTCQVRDARSPIVTCVGEPTSGRETEDPNWYALAARPRQVVVVGAGVAGLETARVAALRGHTVRVVEQSAAVGGVAAVAGPGGSLV
ncbi:MAG: 2,4-dienoyl-CoA reductase, partial [Ilumatobacteraceae bacterium]